MVVVSDPGECTQGADSDGDVRQDTDGEDRVVTVLAVAEGVDNLQK